jgi:ABC-type amino acid transport system, permease component
MHLIFNNSTLLFLLDGLKITIIIAIFTIFLSTIIGTALALIKSYMPKDDNFLAYIIVLIVDIYITIFRCTPNILWILAIRFFVKGDTVFIGIFTFTLFTAPVMAEIVRGGLNGIPKGQFEGAASQGFSFFQTLIYIVLPQTFKSIIPSMLSQIITIIKDTSFLRAIEVPEFTRNSLSVVSSTLAGQPVYVMMSLYALVALVYFIICFILSCIVRNYHGKVKY